MAKTSHMNAVFGAAAIAVALGVASAPALAAPVTFLYQTTIDATAIGGSATEALSLEYTFDTTLANGTGPFGTNSATGSYGPLTATLTLGSESVGITQGGPASTGITVINNGGTTFVADNYGVRGGSTSNFAGTLGGANVKFFQFSLIDDDATMFSDTSLPDTLGFLSGVDRLQVSLDLDTDNNGTADLHQGYSEFNNTPPENLTPFTVTVVADTQVPEPAAAALFGLGLIGLRALRRRR
jgi:hypothetical protein